MSKLLKGLLILLGIILLVWGSGWLSTSGFEDFNGLPQRRGLPSVEDARYVIKTDIEFLTASYEIKDNLLYIYGYWYNGHGSFEYWEYHNETVVISLFNNSFRLVDRLTDGDKGWW